VDFIPLPADVSALAVLDNDGRAMTYAEIVRASVKLACEHRRAGERNLITLSESVLHERVPVLLKNGLVERPQDRNGRPTQRKGIGITPQGRHLLNSVQAKTRLTHS